MIDPGNFVTLLKKIHPNCWNWFLWLHKINTNKHCNAPTDQQILLCASWIYADTVHALHCTYQDV